MKKFCALLTLILIIFISGCGNNVIDNNSLKITPEEFQQKYNNRLDYTHIDDEKYNRIKITGFEKTKSDEGTATCKFQTDSGVIISSKMTNNGKIMEDLSFIRTEGVEKGDFIMMISVSTLIISNDNEDEILEMLKNINFEAISNRKHESSAKNNGIVYTYRVEGNNKESLFISREK